MEYLEEIFLECNTMRIKHVLEFPQNKCISNEFISIYIADFPHMELVSDLMFFEATKISLSEYFYNKYVVW